MTAENLPEALPRAQIHPSAKDLTRSDGDQLIPRLGMDASRSTTLLVV